MIRDGKIKDGGGESKSCLPSQRPAGAGEDNRDIRSRDLASSTINYKFSTTLLHQRATPRRSLGSYCDIVVAFWAIRKFIFNVWYRKVLVFQDF